MSTPVDNYNSSNSSVTFNATVSDNVAVSLVRLYRNFSGIPNGFYVWSYWANDSDNNPTFSSNRTLKVEQIENVTFENVNVTNNLTVGNNVSATRGFFSYLGSSISRIIKGWFNDLDVSGTTNLTGQTYLLNSSFSTGQVLTTNTAGLVSCTNKADVKSGTISITEGSPVIVTFNTSFANTPYCTASVDLSGLGSATKSMAFFTTAPNTTAIRIDWDDTAGGAAKTENIMWVCTNAGNS